MALAADLLALDQRRQDGDVVRVLREVLECGEADDRTECRKCPEPLSREG